LRLLSSYASVPAFLDAYETEVRAGGLLLRGASLPAGTPLGDCEVEVKVAGEALLVPARFAASIPGLGVAVVFPDVAPLAALAARLREPAAPAADTGAAAAAPADDSDEAPRGQLAERLRAMTVSQKMQLALSGDRETRMLLLRDLNKTLHAYVLRNPRIGIDEVQYAAKLTGLSADAFKAISENREWGTNATVCTAIVRNLRSPLGIALKLLERVPLSEVRAIAKGSGRAQIVQAARKRVAG
jgi:hypothetical protein